MREEDGRNISVVSGLCVNLRYTFLFVDAGPNGDDAARLHLVNSMDVGWLLHSSSSWSTGDTINQSESQPADDQAGQVMNGGGETDDAVTAYSLTETVLISAALLIIIVGTIIGNILVCTAVCLVRRL